MSLDNSTKQILIRIEKGKQKAEVIFQSLSSIDGKTSNSQKIQKIYQGTIFTHRLSYDWNNNGDFIVKLTDFLPNNSKVTQEVFFEKNHILAIDIHSDFTQLDSELLTGENYHYIKG
ncbi:MAG: hypothetical protein WBA74_06945 [Cyclobacteriaceae bacterium]